jgi:hypothetical protein
MKKTAIILSVFSLIAGGCNTNKNIPKRLLHFEINGEEINLIHIERIDYFGEEVIYFTIARGEWSKWLKNFAKCKDCSIYVEESYSLRFTQDEDRRFKLEKVNGNITPSLGEPPRLEWEEVGYYPTDNNLWTEIFKFYVSHYF